MLHGFFSDTTAKNKQRVVRTWTQVAFLSHRHRFKFQKTYPFPGEDDGQAEGQNYPNVPHYSSLLIENVVTSETSNLSPLLLLLLSPSCFPCTPRSNSCRYSLSQEWDPTGYVLRFGYSSPRRSLQALLFFCFSLCVYMCV